jgi:hypothetical protein
MNTLAKAHLLDEEHARRAVEMLIQAHFTPDRIHVQVHDADIEGDLPIRHKTRIPFFAAIGALIGLCGGALFGVLVASGVIAPLGPDLGVEGTVLPIISGLLAGLGMGAAWGAIAGMAFWRKELYVPKAAREGSIEIAVQVAPKRIDEVRQLLREVGATNVR